MRPDKVDFYKKIGKKIRILRKAQKMNQSELGNELGMSKSAVSEMEAGKSYIHTPRLEKMCLIFGITPNDFLDWETL